MAQNSFVNDGYPHPGINRQYIGARYVPKFADPLEWSNVLQYEPLTIVSYMGQTYTSKIPVPVGMPPTNTDFWALTGPQNAQVDCLSDKIRELEDRVNNLQKLSFLHKNVVIIGDQWLTQPSTANCALAKIKTAWADSTVRSLQTTTGGYMPSSTGGDSFADILGAAIAEDAAYLEGVDCIIIAGGVNDIISMYKRANPPQLEHFRQGVRSTIGGIRQAAGTIPVYFVYIGIIALSLDQPEIYKMDRKLLTHMDEAARGVSAEFDNVLYLNGAQAWPHNRMCVPLTRPTAPNWWVAPTVTAYGAKDFAESIVRFFGEGQYRYQRSYRLPGRRNVGGVDPNGSKLRGADMDITFDGLNLFWLVFPDAEADMDMAETPHPFQLVIYDPAVAEDGTEGIPVGMIWTGLKAEPTHTFTVIPHGSIWQGMDGVNGMFLAEMDDRGVLYGNPVSRPGTTGTGENLVKIKHYEMFCMQHLRSPVLDM